MPRNAARVLVVDDNEGHRKLLSAILTSQGLDVDFAVNGAQAVVVAKAVAFDLILMDFNMPLMDGMTAAKLIRDGEETTGRPPAKLYIVTSCDTAADRKCARQAGADGYITKPVNFSQIVALANNARSPGQEPLRVHRPIRDPTCT
ncbi:MAG TPA: response regulator [Caulobacteraceae bacterium]|jgi:CheY-like chemotaxis protein